MLLAASDWRLLLFADQALHVCRSYGRITITFVQATAANIGSKSLYISNRRTEDSTVNPGIEVQGREMRQMKRYWKKHWLTYIVVIVGMC